jgi:hypothetical protein
MTTSPAFTPTLAAGESSRTPDTTTPLVEGDTPKALARSSGQGLELNTKEASLGAERLWEADAWQDGEHCGNDGGSGDTDQSPARGR